MIYIQDLKEPILFPSYDNLLGNLEIYSPITNQVVYKIPEDELLLNDGWIYLNSLQSVDAYRLSKFVYGQYQYKFIRGGEIISNGLLQYGNLKSKQSITYQNNNSRIVYDRAN